MNASSKPYNDIFHILHEKVEITKVVYTCLNRVLEKDEDHGYTYENLLEDFQIEVKHLFEQDLVNCSKFAVEQIRSFEKEAEENEATILDIPAFKQLVKYSNVDAVTSAISRKNRQDRAQRRGENTFSPTDSEYLDISSSSDEEYEGMYLIIIF